MSKGSSSEKGGKATPIAPDARVQRRATLLGIPAGSAPTAEAPHREAPDLPLPPGQSQRPSGPQPASLRASLAGLGWMASEEPSVLLVGKGHAMQEALEAALTRHQVECETTAVDAMLSAIVAATPTAVLVLGDAARGSGRAVLEALRSAELDGTVPIVVLLEDASLEARLQAIRAGASAAIPRSASVDQVARRVAEIARSGSRGRIGADPIGETTLSELLSVVGRELTLHLSPDVPGNVDPEEVRLMLPAAPDVVRSLDGFYRDLGAKLERTERAGEDLAHLAETTDDGSSPATGPGCVIAGIRVVLADDDSGRADHAAEELRRLGATVVVTGLTPHPDRMQRLRQSDPMVLLLRAEDLEVRAQPLLEAMKRDTRLRWVTLVVAEWGDLSGPGQAGRAIEALAGQIARTGNPDRSLSEVAELGATREVRLEDLGPARALRAVSACSRPIRLVVDNPRAQITVDLSDGLIAGAMATEPYDWEPLGQGPSALAALLSLASGTLTLSPITGPRTLNVMSTVAAALDLAESEPSPVTPSNPPDALPQNTTTSVVDSGAASSREPAPGRRRSVLLAVASVAILGIAAAFLSGAWARAVHPSPPDAPGAKIPAAPPPIAPREEGASPSPAKGNPEEATAPPLIERARAGDPDAMTALEGRPAKERTVDETLALAEGSIAAEKKAIADLGKQCVEHPELLSDRKVREQWVAHAHHDAVAPEALAAIAAIPGPEAADVLYAVWVGATGRTPATRMAQDLLSGSGIRKEASPALGIALDLRAAETCEDIEALLPRAVADADRRSLRVLGHLVGVRKCGPSKHEDCYPCLSRSALVPKAVRAARSRPGPP